MPRTACTARGHPCVCSANVHTSEHAVMRARVRTCACTCMFCMRGGITIVGESEGVTYALGGVGDRATAESAVGLATLGDAAPGVGSRKKVAGPLGWLVPYSRSAAAVTLLTACLSPPSLIGRLGSIVLGLAGRCIGLFALGLGERIPNALGLRASWYTPGLGVRIGLLDAPMPRAIRSLGLILRALPDGRVGSPVGGDTSLLSVLLRADDSVGWSRDGLASSLAARSPAADVRSATVAPRPRSGIVVKWLGGRMMVARGGLRQRICASCTSSCTHALYARTHGTLYQLRGRQGVDHGAR